MCNECHIHNSLLDWQEDIVDEINKLRREVHQLRENDRTIRNILAMTEDELQGMRRYIAQNVARRAPALPRKLIGCPPAGRSLS